jgi:pimeloyl-ACP methyl ester carboxylesterase
VPDSPETHYTRSADGTNLAYQVSGNGPTDMIFVNAAIPVDLLPEDPSFIRFRRRLDTFSRTVWFDRRGTGTSEGDPHDGMPGETSDADFIAVFDAVGFDRPVLAAEGASGLRAIHFSAIHPERVSALVLINGFAHYVREDDYPSGVPRDRLDRLVAVTKEQWGSAATLELFAPTRANDERFRAWFAQGDALWRWSRFGR